MGLLAFAVAKQRNHTLLGLQIHLPTASTIDRRLVLGSLAFGIGWGLAGICPGPSIVLLGAGSMKGTVFVLAMLAGMAIFEVLEKRTTSAASCAIEPSPGT